MRHTALALFALVPLVACGMPRASASIDAPVVALDVDARRGEVERELCRGLHDDSDGCRVLRALDASDGAFSAPPRLPAFLPQSVEVQGKGAHRQVARWLAGLDNIVPELRLPVGGVVDTDLLSGATLLDARLGVSDDTLTFALPALRIAVAYDEETHDVALVQAGAVDGAPIHFARGGVERLLEAATHDDGEVVLLPDALALDAGPDDTLVTPGGSVNLRVELVVSGDVPLPE